MYGAGRANKWLAFCFSPLSSLLAGVTTCIREYLQGVESLTLQDGPGDAARSPACGIPCPTL